MFSMPIRSESFKAFERVGLSVNIKQILTLKSRSGRLFNPKESASDRKIDDGNNKLAFLENKLISAAIMEDWIQTLGLGAKLATANTPIDPSVFTSDPLTAVQVAAPLWHFDEKTCFPRLRPSPTATRLRACHKMTVVSQVH
jgi:hypothetical protein